MIRLMQQRFRNKHIHKECDQRNNERMTKIAHCSFHRDIRMHVYNTHLHGGMPDVPERPPPVLNPSRTWTVCCWCGVCSLPATVLRGCCSGKNRGTAVHDVGLRMGMATSSMPASASATAAHPSSPGLMAAEHAPLHGWGADSTGHVSCLATPTEVTAKSYEDDEELGACHQCVVDRTHPCTR